MLIDDLSEPQSHSIHLFLLSLLSFESQCLHPLIYQKLGRDFSEIFLKREGFFMIAF